MASDAPSSPSTKPIEGSQGGVRFDEAWNAVAERFFSHLRLRKRVHLEPELEVFLRRFLLAKARRQASRASARGLGIDPEDIAQRVFLKLVESPPSSESSERAER